MPTGSVKWFDNAKGYGFIIQDNTPGDLFVHYTSINAEGFKTLYCGQRVVFEVEKKPKGMTAISVTVVAEEQSDGEQNSAKNHYDEDVMVTSIAEDQAPSQYAHEERVNSVNG